MLDAAGDAYFMELNTAPGMTDHSLVPIAAKAVDMSYEQLCVEILEMTLQRKSGTAAANATKLKNGKVTIDEGVAG